MTAGWAAVMIAALLAAGTALGWLMRFSGRIARMEERQLTVMESMRDDRKATNERLTYLERSVWPRNQHGQPAR